MPTDEQLKLTYEDYCLIPEDGKRHEIIDGEEVVTPAPTTRHQRIVGRLYRLLADHAEGRVFGEVFVAPTDVILAADVIVQPDVLFVAADRAAIVRERGIEGAPDLVVEVVSPGSRRLDEVRKRLLYDRFGVEEYWVVDPELHAVKVYRRTDAGFVRAAELTADAGDALTTPLLPGFEADLAGLFA